MSYKLKGVFQRFPSADRFGRIYSKEVIEKAVLEFSEKIKQGEICVGEMEHPLNSFIDLLNASHKIDSVKMENGEVIVEFTPITSLRYIQSNHEIISTRGDMLDNILSHNLPVKCEARSIDSDEDTEIITFDILGINL